MAFAISFSPASMNTSKYDECIKQLAEAGAGAPAGRLYHACYGDPEKVQVFDVWDSMESFDAFGQILMPILQGLGIDPGTPAVQEIHNIIKG